MQTLTELAQVLEEARRQGGLDYKDLAERTGLTPLSVRNALQAKTALRATNLMALADVLGLELVLVPKAVASSLNAAQYAPEPAKGQEARALFVPLMERVLQSTDTAASPSGRGRRPS